VDKQSQNPSDEAAIAARRLAWAKPEVDRFQAGGAEASDGADTDGSTLS
jgi:hypothetical protein